MIKLHGLEGSKLFSEFVLNQKRLALLPYPLSIVDCHFLIHGVGVSPSKPVTLKRLSNGGVESELVELRDAFDLYDVDRDGNELEIVLTEEKSGVSIYWDQFERFVVVCGKDGSRSDVFRPYPTDVEKHRFVEEMGRLEDDPNAESPSEIYEELLRSTAS